MEKNREQALIEKIIAGDESLYRELVDANSENIFRLIYKLSGNYEDAQDLAQEVFVKAFFSLKKYRGDCQFSTWLFRIAYNETISQLRKNKMTFVNIDEMQGGCEAEPIDDDTDHQLKEERLEAMHLAMEKLSAEERSLMLLFYNEKKSLKELTEISGMSLSNVKIKLFRARKKLETLLKTKHNE